MNTNGGKDHSTQFQVLHSSISVLDTSNVGIIIFTQLFPVDNYELKQTFHTHFHTQPSIQTTRIIKFLKTVKLNLNSSHDAKATGKKWVQNVQVKMPHKIKYLHLGTIDHCNPHSRKKFTIFTFSLC